METDRNAELYSAITKKYEDLKRERDSIDRRRWEAFSLLGHRTVEDTPMKRSPVPETRLYSTAGVIALKKFVDGFLGNIMSENQPWFSARFESESFEESDDIEGANDYMGKASERMRSEMDDKSNFYAENRLAFIDAVVGGCSATYIQNDPYRKCINCKTLNPWDWWCDTNAYGDFDTLYYRYWLTPEQAIERFGDSLSEDEMQSALSSPSEASWEFLMAVFPRNKVPGQRGARILSKSRKFAIVDISMRHCRVVKESGSDIFPVVIHRFERSGDSKYGIGLGVMLLPELRKLNKLAYEAGLSIAKVNHGAYVMTFATVEKFSTDPESRIPVASMEQQPRPLEQSQSPDWSKDMLIEQESKISQLFYNDLFQWMMSHDKVYTATQVNAVKSDELSLLSATFGEVQKQKIDKSLRVIFYLMATNGRLPKPPDGLLKNNISMISFSLDSVLAQSLRKFSYRDANLANWEMCERYITVNKPELLDNFDLDRMVRQIAEGNAISASNIREKSEVDAIRKQREMAIQQQMQQQQELQMSQVARNLGGVSKVNNPEGVNQTR